MGIDAEKEKGLNGLSGKFGIGYSSSKSANYKNIDTKGSKNIAPHSFSKTGLKNITLGQTILTVVAKRPIIWKYNIPKPVELPDEEIKVLL